MKAVFSFSHSPSFVNEMERDKELNVVIVGLIMLMITTSETCDRVTYIRMTDCAGRRGL